MEKTEEILQGILSVLQEDAVLKRKIRQFHAVNGLMLKAFPAISVGIDHERFDEFDNALDEVTAEAKLTYYLESPDAERGEREARECARIIRKVINRDITVKGTVNYIRVTRIEYASVDVQTSALIFAAEITCELQWYEDIGRATESAPPVETINHIYE